MTSCYLIMNTQIQHLLDHSITTRTLDSYGGSCVSRDIMHLGVLPSCKPGVVAGGSHKLNLITVFVVRDFRNTDVQYRIVRVVFRRTAIETLASER